MNLPGRGRVYIVLMHGEKESISGQRLFKDHSWRIVEKGWVSGSENLKIIVKQPLHHHMLFRRVSRKILLAHQKQSPAYSVIRHDWDFKWDWLLWSDETKKTSFLAANTQDGFGEHRDKKVPHVYNEIYCCIFWCCGPIFLLEVLDILFRCMASWILSITNR